MRSLRDWFRGEPSRTERPPRVILVWWGGLPGGGRGATIGDYHAIDNVARWLRDHDVACDIMSDVAGVSFQDVPTVTPGNPERQRYTALAFVCGPLVITSRLRRILKRFRGVPAIAVGVSDVGDHDAPRYFREVVVRDGPNPATFDLALAHADETGANDVQRRARPAVCLRGMQKTYGKKNCLSVETDRLIMSTMNARWDDITVVDTEFRPDNGLAAIEDSFKHASLLVTTRLHGALFALANRVPFVAIDQIRGGAKVMQLMRETKWPCAYRFEDLRPDILGDVVDTLAASGWTSEMEALRSRAIRLSRAAVDQAGGSIARTAQNSHLSRAHIESESRKSRFGSDARND